VIGPIRTGTYYAVPTTGGEPVMGLLITLLVIFLIALVAGYGWRKGSRRY